MMKVDKKESYTILGDEENNIKEFASYLGFIIPKAYKTHNLIIDLLKYDDMDFEDLLAFLKISNIQRGNQKSFVLVNSALNPDKIPEELMVAPTVNEAVDIIELEEIQRDLGF